MTVEELLENEEALERGRQAVEDVLIDYRDRRISQPMRGNGAVCCEADGRQSHIIRLGIDDVLRIALRAVAVPPAAPGGK